MRINTCKREITCDLQADCRYLWSITESIKLFLYCFHMVTIVKGVECGAVQRRPLERTILHSVIYYSKARAIP